MSKVHALTYHECHALAPVGNLAAYIDWTHRIPILSKDEEAILLDQLHNQGDVAAAKKLVMSHLRFVVFVSRGYLGYGLSHEDLIQEGNVGLMKALKRFDPTVGVRLVSFAVHWIKSEIQEFVLKNWRIVKIATTKAARKLFFKKHQLNRYMSQEEIGYLAQSLSVTRKDVEDMLAKLSVANDVSYDPVDKEDEGGTSPSVYLSNAPESCLEAAYIHQTSQQHNVSRLHSALNMLDRRSLDIVKNRWLAEEGNKSTLHDLAKKHGVSAERIRQLESSALEKLKKALGKLD